MHIIRAQSDLKQNQFIKNKLKHMFMQNVKYKCATQGGVNWDCKNYLILKQIIMQI